MNYLILVLAILLCSCDEKQEEVRKVIRPVKVMEIGDIVDGEVQSLPGVTKAVQEVTLSFDVPGKLQELMVMPGDFVKAGQPLAKLDSRDYQNAMNKAKAELDRYKAQYDRITQVVLEGAMSLQEQTNAQSLYFSAKAQLEIAEKALCDTVLRSPFDGVVATRFVDNYENVQAKQSIMRVLNNRKFKITVDMPDELFMRGMSVDKIWVELNLYPGVKFPATLSEHALEASLGTGTYAVTLQFEVDREKYPVQAGISGQVFGSFSDKNKSNYRLVPLSSLLEDGGVKYVLLFDNGLVKRREVQVAQRNIFSDQKVKVSGLNAGEKVITAGVHDLHEGQEIKLLRK